MSVHIIYYKDGAKMMRPIHSREEYLKLRNSEEQQSVVKAVRGGNDQLKSRRGWAMLRGHCTDCCALTWIIGRGRE